MRRKGGYGVKTKTARYVMFGVLIVCALFIVGSILFGAPSLRNAVEPVGVDKICLIRVEGEIVSGSKTANTVLSKKAYSETIITQLKRAAEDSSVKAIVLLVNTPGGSAVASHEIYSEIIKLKSSDLPVFVYMGESATSGGYYISASANYIIANPATMTGSIGVIMAIQDLSEIYDKLGINQHVIKSGTYKDIGSSYRDMTEDEQEILQAMVDDIYDLFVSIVAEGRKMPVEDVKKIADGRIFSGRQALEVGLVDELGTLEDTIAYAREAVGLKPDAPVVEFKEKKSIIDVLLGDILFLNSETLGKLVDSFYSGARFLFMYDTKTVFQMIL
jgi:protease-4